MFQNDIHQSQLRYFGLSLAGLLGCFAALAFWKWQSTMAAVCLSGASLVVGTVYYAVPSTQKPICRGFMTLTKPIQMVATIVILACVYYLILTPIGLVLRMFNHSIRKRTSNQSSCYVDCPPSRKPSRYFDTY